MDQKVFNYLLEIGCCKACGLRYLSSKDIDFSDVDGYIKKRNLINNDVPEKSDDLCVKKCKLNPCTVCLGLLQEPVIDDIINKVLLSEVQKYDSTVFNCSISTPTAILMREYAIGLMLLSNFPDLYENMQTFSLSKTWKLIVKNRLVEKLNMKFENSSTCNFWIDVIMDYEDNNKEAQVVSKLASNKKNKLLSSRKYISDLLSSIPPEEYKDVATFPPEIPDKFLYCKLVTCRHNSVYLAGRYCKFSRELSQSSWIIDGKKAKETSVEEIIFEQINKLFSIPTSQLKFSASGREDCDVRCLGKGRPFYIEISDPKKTVFTFNEFRELEVKINESSLIKVRDLQDVERSELAKIKEGEQMKSKDYVALCITKQPVTQEQMDKIDNAGSLVLKQKTPIRVLHRRPLAVRDKKIEEMKAHLIPGKDNMFILHVVTGAGTYIKEFIHGDFGRTKPSIGTIIDDEVDIIALDVVAVNLDWPKEIDVKTSQVES
ncbi:hypothetical protein ILUMI_26139 [Ignelater luminosus]|uniref:tRNA pseudouridine(55) synthase n=1 Tax=Ignelater luminosus TaxID=2038154 RepID=A0A8K0FZ79_IGNLU|nr:hypothetical protein ILUMI_26139 [Ignelater luminosus]